MKKIYILIIIFLISIIVSSFIMECFDSSEIVVYDENKPTYNIGDLTLTAFYNIVDKDFVSHREKYKENKDEFIIDYINNNKKYFDVYPNSIFVNYIKFLEEKSKTDLKSIELPNIELIRKATDQYCDENKNVDEFFNKINNQKTLFVHVRSGDKGHVSDDFIDNIHSLENEYEKIILLCGVHNETMYSGSIDNSKKNLTYDINKIIGENNQKYIVNIDEPDVHLCYFRKCKNLLLSHGGFSCLGAILFDGDKLYLTKYFVYSHEILKQKKHVIHI